MSEPPISPLGCPTSVLAASHAARWLHGSSISASARMGSLASITASHALFAITIHRNTHRLRKCRRATLRARRSSRRSVRNQALSGAVRCQQAQARRETRPTRSSGPFVAAARQQQRWRVWPRIRLIAAGWRLEVRGRLLRRHAGTRLRLRASPAHRPAHLRRTCARARTPIATWLPTWTISAAPTQPPRHLPKWTRLEPLARPQRECVWLHWTMA
jgi:hypothetical protein